MKGEDALIEQICRRFEPKRRTPDAGLELGAGDDAAILRPAGGYDWVLSADFSLEGVHFRAGYPPDAIGHRALARAASDLGAMGAIPSFFLLSIALPARRTGRWLDRMLAGMARAARGFGLRLIGGDTTRLPNVSISITVVGRIRRGLAIRRSGARRGDRIYVSGRLGAAALGLAVMHRRMHSDPRFRSLVRPHLYPAVPLRLGQWLAARRLPSAMIDLSDGLSSDLTRLARASGVGARIFLDRLPAVSVPPALARRGVDPIQLSLDGGEDYGLLFTVPPARTARIPASFRGIALTCIGEATAAQTLVTVDAAGRCRPLRPAGWDPFRRRR